jgi:hypothetical protein
MQGYGWTARIGPRSAWRCCLQLLLLTSLHPCAWSRHQKDDLSNGEPRYLDVGTQYDTWWHYLSKFTFDEDGGHVAVRLRAKTRGPQKKMFEKRQYEPNAMIKMDLMLYVDSTWNKVPDMEHKKHCIGDPNIPEPDFVATIDFKNGPGWGEWTTQEVDPSPRPHVWHFVLSDCENMLRNYVLEFELEVQQKDGSEFSFERKNSVEAYSLAALLNAVMSLWWYYRMSNLKVKSSMEIHPILWVISIQFGLQLFGHLGHLWHLTDFRADGIGDEFIDAVAEGFFMMNQVLQASVFITIGLGYTILDTLDFVEDSMWIWFIVIFLMVIHAALVFFSRVSGTDQAHRFNGHEGAIGWITATIRTAFYLWFMSISLQTKELLVDKYKPMRGFFLRFQIVATLSFLAYPVTFVILPVIAEYWRHRVLQIVMISVQFVVNVWFAKLFLDSGYFSLKWEIPDPFEKSPDVIDELTSFMDSIELTPTPAPVSIGVSSRAHFT